MFSMTETDEDEKKKKPSNLNGYNDYFSLSIPSIRTPFSSFTVPLLEDSEIPSIPKNLSGDAKHVRRIRNINNDNCSFWKNVSLLFSSIFSNSSSSAASCNVSGQYVPYNGSPPAILHEVGTCALNKSTIPGVDSGCCGKANFDHDLLIPGERKKMTIKEICLKLLLRAGPTIIWYMTSNLTFVATLICVGNFGTSLDLASLGLGISIGNVLCLSIGIGLASSLDTLCSYADGAGVYHKMTRYLFTSFYVLSAVYLVLFFILRCAEWILKLCLAEDSSTANYLNRVSLNNIKNDKILSINSSSNHNQNNINFNLLFNSSNYYDENTYDNNINGVLTSLFSPFTMLFPSFETISATLNNTFKLFEPFASLFSDSQFSGLPKRFYNTTFHGSNLGDKGLLMVTDVLRCLSVGYIANFWHEACRRYLIVQGKLLYPLLITCFTVILHLYFLYIFVNKMSYGPIGAAYSLSLTFWLEFLLTAIYIYICYRNGLKSTTFPHHSNITLSCDSSVCPSHLSSNCSPRFHPVLNDVYTLQDSAALAEKVENNKSSLTDKQEEGGRSSKTNEKNKWWRKIFSYARNMKSRSNLDTEKLTTSKQKEFSIICNRCNKYLFYSKNPSNLLSLTCTYCGGIINVATRKQLMTLKNIKGEAGFVDFDKRYPDILKHALLVYSSANYEDEDIDYDVSSSSFESSLNHDNGNFEDVDDYIGGKSLNNKNLKDHQEEEKVQEDEMCNKLNFECCCDSDMSSRIQNDGNQVIVKQKENESNNGSCAGNLHKNESICNVMVKQNHEEDCEYSNNHQHIFLGRKLQDSFYYNSELKYMSKNNTDIRDTKKRSYLTFPPLVKSVNRERKMLNYGDKYCAYSPYFSFSHYDSTIISPNSSLTAHNNPLLPDDKKRLLHQFNDVKKSCGIYEITSSSSSCPRLFFVQHTCYNNTHSSPHRSVTQAITHTNDLKKNFFSMVTNAPRNVFMILSLSFTLLRTRLLFFLTHCFRFLFSYCDCLTSLYKSIPSKSEIKQFFHYGFPSACLIISEWWCFELLNVEAAFLGYDQLAAFSSVLNFLTLVYMFPTAWSVVLSTFIGSFMGSQDIMHAKLFAKVGVYIICVICTIPCTAMFLFRERIASFFSNQSNLICIISNLLIISSFQIFFDAIVCTLCGVVRGIGMQNLVVWGNLICLWGIMHPFGVYFAFVQNFEACGLLIGAFLSTLTQFFFFSYVIYNTNWKQLAQKNATVILP